MDETSKMLVDALEKIITVDTLLGFILGAAGNTTQQAINLIASGDEQGIREFISNEVAFTEITLSDGVSVPMVPLMPVSNKVSLLEQQQVLANNPGFVVLHMLSLIF